MNQTPNCCKVALQLIHLHAGTWACMSLSNDITNTAITQHLERGMPLLQPWHPQHTKHILNSVSLCTSSLGNSKSIQNQKPRHTQLTILRFWNQTSGITNIYFGKYAVQSKALKSNRLLKAPKDLAQEEISSCDTRRGPFLCHKKKSLLVSQEEVSSCVTRRDLSCVTRRSFFLCHKKKPLLVSQEEVPSCDTRKKEELSSCVSRRGFFLWQEKKYLVFKYLSRNATHPKVLKRPKVLWSGPIYFAACKPNAFLKQISSLSPSWAKSLQCLPTILILALASSLQICTFWLWW